MRHLRSIPILIACREVEVDPKAELMNPESAPQYLCKRCQTLLASEPEYEDYDWFLRCLTCGAKNLLALSFRIVGWRR